VPHGDWSKEALRSITTPHVWDCPAFVDTLKL
jgi:hypothetical protein